MYSHRGPVAVDEGTHYINFVYWASSLQLLIFMMMFSVTIITSAGTIGALNSKDSKTS